jgi:hypothetical protein
VLTAFFELLGELIAALFGRFIPRRRMTPGAVDRAELPPGLAEAVVSALKAGHDAASVLPRGWRGFQTGMLSQAEPEILRSVPIGADLQLAVEPDDPRDRDRVRIMLGRPNQLPISLGYLPDPTELRGPLKRGWVRCWFAELRSTGRHESGAGIVFVAVYDP